MEQKNNLCNILQIGAILVFIGGACLGYKLGDEASFYGEFSWGTAFIVWLVAFIQGIIILVWAEILNLLHKIQENTHPLNSTLKKNADRIAGSLKTTFVPSSNRE